ncbi:MAG TPA: hypothetical protein VNG51_19290 [Ktedonobacteraceae bacterium]|nr:hypothetical protein [Ktedonobacteraceae bacterium]
MNKLLQYNFYEIFTYDARNGILLPKYDVLVTDVLHRKGIAITQRHIVGLNMFDYIGRSLVGQWDKKREMLEIVGFC